MMFTFDVSILLGFRGICESVERASTNVNGPLLTMTPPSTIRVLKNSLSERPP